MTFRGLVSFTVPYKRYGLNKLFSLKLLALNLTAGMFLSVDSCLFFKSAVCALHVPMNKVYFKLLTEQIASA